MNVLKSDNLDFPRMWGYLCSEAAYIHPAYEYANLEYYRTYANGFSVKDCSVVIEDQDLPLAGILMTINESINGSCELSCNGRPILYLESQNINKIDNHKAHKILKSELEGLLKKYNVTKIIYRDLLVQNQLSFISQYLLVIGAVASPHFTQRIELSPSESSLYQQVRKSYKSLINWGEKNLVLTFEDADTIQEESIERFRQLHIQAAGRETRSQETWQSQYEMVRHGEAFLIFGELEGELVTAALFSCSSMYCVYGVSASNRDLFDKPLSHAVLWNAMLYAKGQGCSFLEMGKIRFPNQGNPVPSKKELGISTFKRGFGGQLLARLNVIWGKY